jgi:WD40 repeat protein
MYYTRIDDDDDEQNTYPIKGFVGILSKQLLIVGEHLKYANHEAVVYKFTFNPRDKLISSQDSSILTEEDVDNDDVEFEDSSSSVSGMSESMNNSSGGNKGGCVMTGGSSSTFEGGDVKYGDKLAHFTDRMENIHTVAKYPWKVQKTKGKGYTPARYCSMECCKCLTRVFCVQCNKPYYFGLRKDVM